MARKKTVVEPVETAEITFDSCLERVKNAEKQLVSALKAWGKAEKNLKKILE